MAPTSSGNSALPKVTPERLRDQLLAADLDMVSAWAEALVKTVEANRLPTRQEETLQRLANDLDLRTQACLRQLGDLTLAVGESHFSFAGHVVYHTATEKESIPGALYYAGVEQLTLRQGVDSGELRALVNILRAASDEVDRCLDDAVTLLWDQSFDRIAYTLVSLAELERRERSEASVGVGASGDHGIPWPPGHDDHGHAAAGVRHEGRSDDWAFRVNEAPPKPESSQDRFALTDVEAENIRMVARIEEVNSPQDQLLEIFFMILHAEESPAEYLEMASTMARLLEYEIEAGNVERARDLLEQLRAIPNSKTAAQGEFQAATDQVVQKIARPDLMVRFATVLRSRRDVNLGELTKFFVLLGTAAAPTLCDLLGEAEDRRTRRALCEALAILCKNDVEVLIRRLWDSRWFVVRNLLCVLGRIGHQGVERALGEALYHADVRVRREAVRALSGIDSAVSRAYLNSALRDTDRSVRILVAQTVVKRVDERAAQVLWSVIESPEFVGRDAEERTAFFVAFGRAGSDTLVPRLEKILTRGGLFRSGPVGGRAEAAMALAWIGTPAAFAILNREVTSAREEVRRAVEQALEALRKASEKQKPSG
jgi:HEAT repeats